MRGIAYQFPRFRALSLQLEAGGDEQDLELPLGVTGADGEWVLATFGVGEESVSVPACIVDRGYGLRLAFEDHDWQHLWKFANTNDEPSLLPPTVPPPQGEPSVLIVDGDPEAQRSLTALLQGFGYGAVAVGSAEDAVARLRQLRVQLMLLEWTLPRMNGLDLCRAVRRDARYGRLPVLFVTARASLGELVAAFEAGADDVVKKPFRPPELRARVQGLLRRAAMAPYEPPAR